MANSVELYIAIWENKNISTALQNHDDLIKLAVDGRGQLQTSTLKDAAASIVMITITVWLLVVWALGAPVVKPPCQELYMSGNPD